MDILSSRIARKHLIAATLAVIIAVSGAAIGWLSVGELSAQADTANQANNEDTQVLAAALAIATHSGQLVDAGATPDFTLVGDPEIVNQLISASESEVARHKATLEQQIDVLRGKGYDERVERIEVLVDELVTDTELIVAGWPELVRISLDIAVTRVRLLTEGFHLIEGANNRADDDFYDLMGDEIKWSFQNDLRRYSHTQLAERSSSELISLVGMATALIDPELGGLVEDYYISTANRLDHSIDYLQEDSGEDLEPDTVQGFENLLEIGNSFFSGQLEDLSRVLNEEEKLRAKNQETLASILAELNYLSALVQGQTPTPIPEQPPPGVPGVSDDAILFGQSAALSGPAMELGSGMELGIRAAFNEAGSVHSRQLQLLTVDDAYEAERAYGTNIGLVRYAQVFGLIGAVGTPTSLAASPIVRESGVPFIGPFTGANFLRDDTAPDTVVNYRASYYQETERMVRSLTQAGVTKVAVLYQNDSYGRDGLNGVAQALKRRNLEPVASGYYMRNTTAVKRAVFQIAEAKPQAVIIIGAYAPAAEAIKRLRDELEPDPVFMAVSFVGSKALAEELGDDGAGVYVTQVTPLPDDQNSQVVQNYRAALSEVDPDAEPGFVSLEGYLVGRLAIAGLDACGPDLTRECFLDALRDADTINIDGIQLRFGPDDNQGSDGVLLTVLGADGSYSRVDSITRAP